MTATATALLTFAEFEQLPDPTNGDRLELHHGEVISVPPPILRHWRIERRLMLHLQNAFGDAGEVGMEAGFRTPGGRNYRIADVAFVTKARLAASSDDGYLESAPELVVEVLSPSNSASEMLDREQLCLENGTLEFWVVDPTRRQVRVSKQEGRPRSYKAGDEIPLMFGGSLAVDSIFEA